MCVVKHAFLVVLSESLGDTIGVRARGGSMSVGRPGCKSCMCVWAVAGRTRWRPEESERRGPDRRINCGESGAAAFESRRTGGG